jgi:hypothetical protein
MHGATSLLQGDHLKKLTYLGVAYLPLSAVSIGAPKKENLLAKSNQLQSIYRSFPSSGRPSRKNASHGNDSNSLRLNLAKAKSRANKTTSHSVNQLESPINLKIDKTHTYVTACSKLFSCSALYTREVKHQSYTYDIESWQRTVIMISCI